MWLRKNGALRKILGQGRKWRTKQIYLALLSALKICLIFTLNTYIHTHALTHARTHTRNMVNVWGLEEDLSLWFSLSFIKRGAGRKSNKKVGTAKQQQPISSLIIITITTHYHLIGVNEKNDANGICAYTRQNIHEKVDVYFWWGKVRRFARTEVHSFLSNSPPSIITFYTCCWRQLSVEKCF